MQTKRLKGSFLAIQHKRRDKVIEFFDVFGADLHGKPEWSHWFGKLQVFWE